MTQNTPKPSSGSPSPTGGKVSTLSEHQQALQLREQQLQTKALNSLRASSAPGIYKATPEAAFTEGTSLQTALRHQPEQTRMTVVRLITDTVKFIDAKKTLDTPEAVLFTADAILSNNPTTTVEELRLTCDRMKAGHFGKFYERLKTAEFIECLNQTEAARCDFLERRHQRTSATERTYDPAKITWEPQSMADLVRKRNPFIAGAIAREQQTPNDTAPEDLAAQPQPEQPQSHQGAEI